jgi:hypothetical protein
LQVAEKIAELKSIRKEEEKRMQELRREKANHQ